MRPSEWPQRCNRVLEATKDKGWEVFANIISLHRKHCCFPARHCVVAPSCLWVLWRLLRLSVLFKSLPVTLCDPMALEAVGHTAAGCLDISVHHVLL